MSKKQVSECQDCNKDITILGCQTPKGRWLCMTCRNNYNHKGNKLEQKSYFHVWV